jgi:zinc transport system ATP-binding protein
MNNNQLAVEVKDVTVSRSGILMLDRVSLAVHQGDFAAIVGPNGAGKTTLLKVIIGLLKPDSGTSQVMGATSGKLTQSGVRIGYVPQIMSLDLSFPVSVFDTVLMGTYGTVGVGRRAGRADKDRAFHAMERVGIADLGKRPIGRLSGGQRQRVFIARALANDPHVLILDEPTTGVDSAASWNLYALLHEIKNSGVTTLLVSHDIGVVASYVDVVACLNKSVVAHGRPEDVLNSKSLTDMYGCDAAYLHHGNAPHVVVEEHDHV